MVQCGGVKSKQCTGCKRDRPLECFHRSSEKKDGLKPRCKECIRLDAVAYYSNNKDVLNKKSRDHHWMNREAIVTRMNARRYLKSYGLTKEEKSQLAVMQSDVCAICLETASLGVDHCHKTGLVRGLLCPRCNFGLGHLRDSPVLLERAIEYLNKGGVAKGYGLERYGKILRD